MLSLLHLLQISLSCLLVNANHLVLVNILALDESSTSVAISHFAKFYDSVLLNRITFWTNTTCILLIDRQLLNNLPVESKKSLTDRSGCSISYNNITEPLPDKSVSRHSKTHEFVTVVLDNLFTLCSKLIAGRMDTVIVSVSISNETSISMTQNFPDVYNRFYGSNGDGKQGISHDRLDVILLGKTRRMTSVSDWHDLLLVGLRVSTQTIKWLQTVIQVFYKYATNREAFTLLDPRPALLEASLQLRTKLRLGFFRKGDICVKRLHGDRVCKSSAVMELTCLGDTNGHRAEGSYPCTTVDEPNAWRMNLDRDIGFLQKKFRLEPSKWSSSLSDLMNYDGHRFILAAAENSTEPKTFCWQGSSKTDYQPKTRVYDGPDKSTPFVFSPSTTNKSNIVMVSGLHGSAHSLDTAMYSAISKTYYCKRHGYQFVQMLSNQFDAYFPHNLWETIPGGQGYRGGAGIFRGTMTKVTMILDALFRHPGAEWIVWMDDDMWINPGFLNIPLEDYLSEVPSDKIIVLGNYRSVFTNFMFWRNSPEGRALAMDWLAVAMSGHVQCHGFDQASLQMLLMLRLSGSFALAPLNFTVLWTPAGNTGCNDRNDYSVDFDFEVALNRAGFRASGEYYHMGQMSSVTRGFASDHFPVVHILRDSNRRPRLQCGYCNTLDRIQADHCYDGPFCGGNCRLLRNSTYGWFANHKSLWLMFEAYLQPHNCKSMPMSELIPPCRKDRQDVLLEGNKKATLVSLVDGYAFDLDLGSYCRVSDAIVIHQSQVSYMREYKELFRRLRQVDLSSWLQKYADRTAGVKCVPTHDEPEDIWCKGEKFLRPKHDDFESMEKCRTIPNDLLQGLSKGKRAAVDCLSDT